MADPVADFVMRTRAMPSRPYNATMPVSPTIWRYGATKLSGLTDTTATPASLPSGPSMRRDMLSTGLPDTRPVMGWLMKGVSSPELRWMR